MPRKKVIGPAGGFTDVKSFREEAGVSEDDMSDQEVLAVINEDAQQTIRLAEDAQRKLREEKDRLERTAESERRRLALEKAEAEQRARNLESSLELEKGKRRIYEAIINPYDTVGSVYGVYGKDMLQDRLKERLKDQIKRELEEEKAEARRWKAAMREPRSKSPKKKSRSPKRSRSKSPKKKSKSKTRK